MRSTTLVGLLAATSLIVAACGDTADDAAATTDTAEMTEPADTAEMTEPADTADTAAAADTTEPADPTEPAETAETAETTGDVAGAIVSLSPSATEMLYAIGAGDQVIAVDDFSNWPPETAAKMPGISGFEPNVEAIAGLEPDLVVSDGTSADLLDQLDALGIAHWEGPAATGFDDVYAQIEQLGDLTGRGAEAREVVGNMRTDVEAVRAGLPELDEPLTYYHELDPTHFSVTSGTFIGVVYAEIGLVNIADGSGVDSPYPQLNAEYIIESDPDLIFLACTVYCGTTAGSVGERPGWENLTAVTTGGVVEMDDDIASRWGPRIVEYLELAGQKVAEIAALRTAG